MSFSETLFLNRCRFLCPNFEGCMPTFQDSIIRFQERNDHLGIRGTGELVPNFAGSVAGGEESVDQLSRIGYSW